MERMSKAAKKLWVPNQEAVSAERPDPSFLEDDAIKGKMESLKLHPGVNKLLNNLWIKDPYTYAHSHRVADFSQWIGQALGLNDQERVELYLCGLLHDVGKTFTPDEVLKKPGPLSPQEFAIIKKHPEDSGRLVRSVADIAYLESPIRGHHERMDGKGYPDHKVGDQIHIYSRIILIADTFDAMTSNRIYRKKLYLERTYEELDRCAGTQFDPEAAKAFVALHQKFIESFDIKKIAA